MQHQNIQPGRGPLTLHESELSNPEYEVYIASVAEAARWGAASVGACEARGWIKGRCGIDHAVLDKVSAGCCYDG